MVLLLIRLLLELVFDQYTSGDQKCKGAAAILKKIL